MVLIHEGWSYSSNMPVNVLLENGIFNSPNIWKNMWFHYFLNVMSSSVLPKREFIELYRSFPCLQQVKNAEYSDRNKKSQAYETMIEK